MNKSARSDPPRGQIDDMSYVDFPDSFAAEMDRYMIGAHVAVIGIDIETDCQRTLKIRLFGNVQGITTSAVA